MGSFANVLVFRTRASKKGKQTSVFAGRSACPHCKRSLAPADLIPLLSWITIGGRCRYCHKPISRQYPIVEATMAIVFGLSFAYWPAQITGVQWLLLGTWLTASIGLLALAVYDFRWMILPNKLIYSTLTIAVSGRLIYILGYSGGKASDLTAWLGAVIVASGLFWLIFYISQGKWIGYGDVRLGLITGTLLATPAKSLLMIFLASILGTIVVLPSVVTGNKKLNFKLPYGPFLIAATFIVMLFGQPIIGWYTNLLGL